MWFIGAEVEQETSAPTPKKNSWIRPWAPSFFVPTQFVNLREHF